MSFIVHPQLLRHACGYALANKVIDIRILQAYLGHRSINSTSLVRSLFSRPLLRPRPFGMSRFSTCETKLTA